MIISVASGKGGTGKTTVAVNIALGLDNVLFIDCDVEEPNANVFLKSKITDIEDVNVEIPVIDEDKCDYCRKCSDFCAYNALAVVKSNVLVFPELCHSCGGCKIVCPRDAIIYKDKKVGILEHGKNKNIEFYHGLLNIGEIQAVPVIKKLKQKIDKNRDVIIDAPPGTSCPVIETINSSDYCILVTEPTPFGLNDLKLAVEVVKHMKIPFGVIINRDGVGNNDVEDFCKNKGIPLLLKIPQSEKIAKLYSEGIPFVKELDEYKKSFKELYEKIREEVELS